MLCKGFDYNKVFVVVIFEFRVWMLVNGANPLLKHQVRGLFGRYVT